MIDSNSYMQAMKEIIESGHPITMNVSGNSMAPFLIHQRDFIYIEPLTKSPKVGDMCFFQRNDGTFIMHRICNVSKNKYWFIGDAQILAEGPIAKSQIFGIITKVKRKETWISSHSFCWFFFQKIWIHLIPFRRKLIALYSYMFFINH